MEEKGHYIFSDESGWNKDQRFGSLAKISGSYQNTKELNYELQSVLEKYQKNEIKFHNIKGENYYNIATEFFTKGFEFLKKNKIKVHILVWDKHDKRHNVLGRSDVENLKRMYFHNLKVVKKHWGIDTKWSFFPDEFNQINWEEDVIKYFNNLQLLNHDPSQLNLFNEVRDIRIKYNNVKELQSVFYPIIQLADLFAGVIRTSRNESDKFYTWYSKSKDQYSLFDDEEVDISKNMLPKYKTMKQFKLIADKNSMGVSINKLKYFKTFNNKNNIFIWHYEPQSELDKAPTIIK